MSMHAGSRPLRLTADDFNGTAPDTPAGQYLRKFWQPVYHSVDLLAGRPVPLQILNESFTLYRGSSGQVFIIDHRCPHRGLQLSTGWVEGDDLRCFYHGWKFAGDGKCIEQPVEANAFCDKVKLRSYPTREYLGLIFGYFGEGEPPPFSLYPQFEHFDGYGMPAGRAGDEVAEAARFAAVGYAAVMFDTVAGGVAAAEMVARWSGRALDPAIAWGIAESIPPEWYGGDLSILESLIERLLERRTRVRELIAQFRESSRNPFPNWGKDEENSAEKRFPAPDWMHDHDMEGGGRIM